MEKYLWKIKNYEYSSLSDSITCDTLIVGGGITGISLLYYLKDYDKKIVLIERNKIGEAATMKSSAKLTILQEDIALKIKKCYDFNKAKEYIDAQYDAIEEIVKIIKSNNIKCNLEENISYLYTNAKKNKKKLKNLYILYRDFGYNPFYSKIPKVESSLSFGINKNYVFHPLLYIKGLLKVINKTKNINIYENTAMISYKKKNHFYIVKLNNGNEIVCKNLVFANQYLPFVIPYFLPFKNYLEISDICVMNDKNKYYNAINIDKVTESIRFHNNDKIIVKNSKMLSNRKILKSTNSSWKNYDLITFNHLPLIGEIKDGMYIATGYNTWGMTNSNIAARIIADSIQNKENKLKNIFKSYYPINIYTLFRSTVYNFKQISHLVSSYFVKSEKVRIVIRNGKRYGVYIDENGKEHIVKITCPHMKCGLQFNDDTLRWECPCHGSEFDIDGNIVRGPSTKCIRK